MYVWGLSTDHKQVDLDAWVLTPCISFFFLSGFWNNLIKIDLHHFPLHLPPFSLSQVFLTNSFHTPVLKLIAFDYYKLIIIAIYVYMSIHIYPQIYKDTPQYQFPLFVYIYGLDLTTMCWIINKNAYS